MAVLLISVKNQLTPREKITFSEDNFIVHGMGKEPQKGFYVDYSYDGNEKKIVTEEFNVSSGVYRITLKYETNNVKGTGVMGSWSHVIGKDVPSRWIESGKSRLIQGLND